MSKTNQNSVNGNNNSRDDSDNNNKGDYTKTTFKKLIGDLNVLTKVGLVALPIAAAYYATRQKFAKHSFSFVVSVISHACSLVSLSELYQKTKRDLGVKSHASKTHLFLSVVGHIIFTSSLTGLRHTPIGKEIYVMNVILTIVYFRIFLMSIIYNSGLPHPSLSSRNLLMKRRNKSVSWVFLITFGLVVVSTLMVFANEFRPAVSDRSFFSMNSSVLQALFGYTLLCFATFSDALRSSLTSIPTLSPLKSIVSMITSLLLNSASLIPLLQTSASARIYFTGNLARAYSLFVVAFLHMQHSSQIVTKAKL